MQASKSKLQQLQTVISKMSLEACVSVIPEFGVKWRDVSQAVRNCRLPMHASSVARVLCRHAANNLPEDELHDILARLSLKLVTTQSRTWHVIRLLEPEPMDQAAVSLRTLPHRMRQALKNHKHHHMTPQVESITMGDLIYISVQFVSATRESSILYLCTAWGSPLVLASSVPAARLLQACIQGLGYKSYKNLQLHGRHIPSLLRLGDPSGGRAEHLSQPPEYRPTPVATANGVDYTNREYDENYVDSILGPDPPLLTDLTIKSTRMFFDESRLHKTIRLSVSLKSEDVSKSLKAWVAKGALSPTSDFFHIFHQIKSNKIQYTRDSD